MCWIEKERVEIKKKYLGNPSDVDMSVVDRFITQRNMFCPETIDEGTIRDGFQRVTLILTGESADIEEFKKVFSWN